MTIFTDGPAAGKVLSLSRAPLFLRVTVDGAGKIDALDQLDDVPRLGETVHVYILVSRDGSCFLDYTDNQGRRRGRQEESATYRLCEQQPSIREARFTTEWQKWAEAHGAEVIEQRKREIEANSRTQTQGA